MIPLYGIFYMVSFMLVERSDVKIHIIHSLADDKNPVLPVFYYSICDVVLFSDRYSGLFRAVLPGQEGILSVYWHSGSGNDLVHSGSYVYPNGQNLRPDLTGESGIFISAVRFLYKIDTPTNIFPSIHVFNSVASCVALFQNERCRKNKVFTAAQTVLTVSIIMATMFLKQHCVSDVMTALILNILCYQLFYRVIPARQEKLAEVFTRKEILTVPNLLSLIRLGLAILFLGICERHGMRGNRPALTMIILAAAATDFLDGRIARSFNQISRIGRLLDPLADKAMQAVMLACLISRYPLVKLVMILFVIKETYMLVVGWKVIMETDATGEAQWHGKLNTAVTYVVVMILTAGVRLPYSTANVLIGACAVCMTMSFVMYGAEFREALERKNGLMGPKYRRNLSGRDWI